MAADPPDDRDRRPGGASAEVLTRLLFHLYDEYTATCDELVYAERDAVLGFAEIVVGRAHESFVVCTECARPTCPRCNHPL